MAIERHTLPGSTKEVFTGVPNGKGGTTTVIMEDTEVRYGDESGPIMKSRQERLQVDLDRMYDHKATTAGEVVSLTADYDMGSGEVQNFRTKTTEDHLRGTLKGSKIGVGIRVFKKGSDLHVKDDPTFDAKFRADMEKIIGRPLSK